MYNWNPYKLDAEYAKWLEENCKCECESDCECLDFDDWFDEKQEQAAELCEPEDREEYA